MAESLPSRTTQYDKPTLIQYLYPLIHDQVGNYYWQLTIWRMNSSNVLSYLRISLQHHQSGHSCWRSPKLEHCCRLVVGSHYQYTVHHPALSVQFPDQSKHWAVPVQLKTRYTMNLFVFLWMLCHKVNNIYYNEDSIVTTQALHYICHSKSDYVIMWLCCYG